MSSWLLKTGAQHIFSCLPRSDRWNELLQRHVTGGLRLEVHDEFLEKVRACRRHLDYYETCSRRPREDFSALEIGTGWFPIIPLGLYLCGAREIWTYDIVRLLRLDTFYTVLDYYILLYRTGELKEVLPAAIPSRVERLVQFSSSPRKIGPEECLERLGIHALIGDVRVTGLPQGSIDFVFSHGVLEHFPWEMLVEALKELRRVSGQDSVMSHYLGLADQFASFDRSITPYNFLRYSKRAWRWLDSPMIPQNRLRISDYRTAFSGAGFVVAASEDIRGKEEDLASIRLAPEFVQCNKDDLLVLFSWLITRPKESAMDPTRVSWSLVDERLQTSR
jgi:hypothetical protein